MPGSTDDTPASNHNQVNIQMGLTYGLLKWWGVEARCIGIKNVGGGWIWISGQFPFNLGVLCILIHLGNLNNALNTPMVEAHFRLGGVKALGKAVGNTEYSP